MTRGPDAGPLAEAARGEPAVHPGGDSNGG
jgi:hypothetical protein